MLKLYQAEPGANALAGQLARSIEAGVLDGLMAPIPRVAMSDRIGPVLRTLAGEAP